jgi:hypothetical protein
VQVFRDGNCLTAWPTKLALVPQLVAELVQAIAKIERSVRDGHGTAGAFHSARATPSSRSWERLPTTWPRPEVALPPWETARWLTFKSLPAPASVAGLPKAA